jgi:hypothetical protein
MKSQEFWKRVKEWILTLLQFLFNPRFLLCFGIAWMITNGWSYLLLILGSYFDIGWMMAVSGAYIAFLWLPVSPEKIVTVSIAIVLLKFLFPRDKKTLGVLQDIISRTKQKSTAAKQRRRTRRHKLPPSLQAPTTDEV